MRWPGDLALARFRRIGRGADGNLEVEDPRERLRLAAPVCHRPRHLERHPVDAGRLTLYRRGERLLPARRGELQQLVTHRERAGLLPLVLAEESRLVEERLALRLDDEPLFPRGRQRLLVLEGVARRDARRHQATDRRHCRDVRAGQISRRERNFELAPGEELLLLDDEADVQRTPGVDVHRHRAGALPVFVRPANGKGALAALEALARFEKIRSYARMRLALFISKRHRRSREFGWSVVTYQSPNQLGLITLSGIVVDPRPFRDWRGRPNAGGERRR